MGQEETAAHQGGTDQGHLELLEAMPLRTFSYHGVTLSELDLEAVIARKPQVVIIDEVAHSNVPGSTHNKRWQDVLAILDVGINVICAFNVQHVESLNGVSDVVIGRTEDSLLRQALLRSFTSRMIRRAAGLDLHIVSFRGASEESRPDDAGFTGQGDS